MKKKTPVPAKGNYATTVSQEVGKNRTWLDFMSDGAFSLFPEKENWRKGFILTLMNWGAKEDSLILEDFLFEHRLPRTTLWQWREKYPDVAAAIENVKIFIGARRRKLVMMNKLNSIAYKDMHVYDKEWGALVDKYHSDLKKAEEQTTKEFNITMVSARKKEEPSEPE